MARVVIVLVALCGQSVPMTLAIVGIMKGEKVVDVSPTTVSACVPEYQVNSVGHITIIV